MDINHQKIRGFSLVELMVAMAIGLTVLAAVSMVLVNSKKNYTTQDSLARLQENARFAMQFLTRDLRMSRFFGCPNALDKISSTVNGSFDQTNAADQGNPLEVRVPIRGIDNAGAWRPTAPIATLPTPSNMVPGTDAILLLRLDVTDPPVPLVAPFMSEGRDPLNINIADRTLSVGNIVMVTDCTRATMFQISGPGTLGTPVNGVIQHAAGGGIPPGNSTGDFGQNFIYEAKDNPRIYRFYFATYYIRNNASGEPTLYRDSSDGGAQELVEGIEDLQILYGENAGTDAAPNVRYRTAAAVGDWTKLYSIQINLRARTLAHTDVKNADNKQFGTEIDTKRYDMDGDGNPDAGPFNDRYQRRVFRTTVVLRNYP